MSEKRVRQKLTLCPTDWDYEDLVGKDDALQIRAWCLDSDNVPALVRYETFKPFIYFELPLVGQPGGKKKWDVYDAEEIHRVLQKAIKLNGKYLDDFASDDFVKRKTLYYYQREPRPMLRLRFRNLRAMNHAAAFLRKGLFMPGHRQLAGRVHLTEIDPVLKMLVDTDLTHTCWFDVKASKVTKEVDKISRLENEYICKDWKSMVKSEYSKPYNPLILSYDIETYSHNHKAFPRKWCKKDVISTIGCVYFRPQSTETEEYAFVLGDCTYDPRTDNFTLIRCKTERQLIYKYYELMRQKDPDIITGYNIVQYDNDYIAARLERIDAKFPELGRLKGKLGKVSRTEWGSAAYGKVKKMAKWYMPGRVVMDYYEECIRTRKWSSYSLKNAAKMILKNEDNEKIDLSYEQTFINYEQMRYWKDRPDCEEKTAALDAMRDVVVYCIRDASLPADMAKKTNWIIASVEMSNVVGVTMQDMFLGGQQRRCVSLLYRAAYKNGIVIDMRPDKHSNFYYAGGLVQDPIQGFHELVLTLDFASLYPNIMIRHNLGHDTLIHPDDVHLYDDATDLQVARVMVSDVPEDDGELESKKKKKEDLPKYERVFRTINREKYVGITPRILIDLIAMRGKVRAEQKNYVEGVDLMWTILELRQLAYKVSSNSMYGFFGVRVGGKRPCLEISAMVTFFARESITTAINKIKKKYNDPSLPAEGIFAAGEGCKLIYGDTDSCMFQFRGVKVANAWDRSRELARFATSLFPPPLKMEAEWPADMLAMKMKHYAKMKVDPETNDYFRDKNGMREIEFKGLMPARRDTCTWAKRVCSGVIALIMEGCGYAECVDYIAYNVNELYNGNVSIDDLVVSKTLNSGYTNETATMATFAAEMAKIDKVITPGERHQFVVCDRGKNKKRVGEKMMLLQAYESGECDDPIDYSYYYHNLLMKKLDIIMDAEYKEHAEELSKVQFKVKGRITTGVKPAKLIYQIGKEHTNPEIREKHLSNLVDLVQQNFGYIGVR